MNLWPFKKKAISLAQNSARTLMPVDTSRGWTSWFTDLIPGSFQKDIKVNEASITAYWAVFACITLIAGDIAKLEPNVMQIVNGIGTKTNLRLVLRNPNRYQTRVEFYQSWVISLMRKGNAYMLKERDEQGFIVALYVLDPCLVVPLITDAGDIYYQLNIDNMAGLKEQVIVPASEIIHDRIYTLFHPLVGISPLYACGVAATQGLAIQNNSANFFTNGSMPGGIIMVPGALDVDKAKALKEKWDTNYGGENRGKTAVLADKMTYQALTMNATDSQLIEQLKMTAEMVCACFHIPGYKIGVGQMPTAANTGVLNQQYYDQCLHLIIENMELRLDEGLELAPPYQTWFDLGNLLRMDPQARYTAHGLAIKDGWGTPNEARKDEDLPPVAGGDTPYMQQQNYSLAALDRRDTASADGTTDVQSAAMNGAQVTSLQGLIVAAATGEIPPETARAAIAAAFPLLSTAQIDNMIGPLGNPEPAAPPAPAKAARIEYEDNASRLTKSLAIIASLAPITIPNRAMN